MFIHWHVHSHYSLLDGESSPLRLATMAKELGMPALCLTDHNHLLGAIDFKDSCEAIGIQPILGLESYYTDDTSILSLDADERFKMALQLAQDSGVVIPKKPKPTKKAINKLIEDYAYPTKQFHILFLAKNEIGYKNLVRLQSEAAKVCTYNKRYICDNKIIEKYKEGLIMTTACIGSRTAKLIAKDKQEEAEALIVKWHDMMKDDFYLEIQPLLNEDQYKVNCFYMQMSDKYNIKLVATNDVHYAAKEDIDDHDSLLCIGTGKFKDEEDRMHYQPEFWLRSEEEMRQAFSDQYDFYGECDKETYLAYCEKAMFNTNDVLEKCTNNYNIGADYNLFPKIEIGTNETPARFLERICWDRLYQYLTERPELNARTYEARLNEELNTINPKGFAPYMLVNQEMMDWCKTNKIPTGPGRGSAAGSLVLLLLGITKLVDPIKEKLLFSRFLTKDRTSNPDIDNDFSYKRRGEVIGHLQEKYGYANVAHIGTITFMGVKSGIKDFGRIFRQNFDMLNKITADLDEIMDYVPSYKFKHIDKLGLDEKYKEKYERFKALEAEHAELFRLARKYEGTPRNSGVHASGILVTPVPVSDVFPTRIAEDGTQACLFTGEQLDRFNALN